MLPKAINFIYNVNILTTKLSLLLARVADLIAVKK